METVINGDGLDEFGENWLDKAKTGAVLAAGAEITTAFIGDPYHAAAAANGGDAPLSADTWQIAGHAAVGCAMGAAISKNCVAGAAGAVAGELGAEWTGNADAGKIISAVSGLAVGKGGSDTESVNVAYLTGGNAIDNNYLETAYDVAQIGLDAAKIAKGKADGNEELVTEGQVDLAFDSASAAIPFLPAGVSKFARAIGLPVDKIAGWFSKGGDVVDTTTTFNKIEKAGSSGGERAGQSFTKKQKIETIDESAKANDGIVKCNNCGTDTVPAQKSVKGVTPATNETQIDHVIPRSKGGNTDLENRQVLCRDCNIKRVINDERKTRKNSI